MTEPATLCHSPRIGNDENRLVKLTADRPFDDPEKAARRLLEHAHAFQDHIGHTCRNQAYTYRIATRRTRVDRDSRLPKAGVQFVSADRADDGRWRGKRHWRSQVLHPSSPLRQAP